MNIFECVIDAANETETSAPTTTTVPTLVEYIRWANKGQDSITNATDCLEQLITFSSVAQQEKYSSPANFIRPIHTEWAEASNSIHKLNYKNIKEFRQMQSFSSGGGTPKYITLWNKNIHIYPVVTSAAGATTLTGSHAATLTTITVASTTSFPSRGRIIIGDEVIEYTNKTTTTFTGAERGAEGTTAAAQSASAAVTERDISIYSSVRYLIRKHNIYTTGTAVFTKASTAVVGTSTLWDRVPNAYPAWEIGTGTNPSKWYTISSITDDTNMVLTSAFLEETIATTTDYVIASMLELPTEMSELLTLYMIIRTKKRLELLAEVKEYEQEFYSKLRQAKIDFIDRTNIEYPSLQDTLLHDE